MSTGCYSVCWQIEHQQKIYLLLKKIKKNKQGPKREARKNQVTKETEDEERPLNSFYETKTSITPKTDNTLQENKIIGHSPQENRFKYPKQNISKSNSAIDEKE